MPDLDDPRGGQPGRSSKARNGCGAAASVVLRSTLLTRARTSPANASSVARPKKKRPPMPPALPPAVAAAGTGAGVWTGRGWGATGGTR